MTGLRSRGTGVMKPTHILYRDANTVTLAMPAGQRGTVRSITEMCTDGWRNAIFQGDVIVGAMDRVVEIETGGNGSWSQVTPEFGVNCEYYGDFGAVVMNSGGVPAIPAVLLTREAAEGLALTSAHAKANEGTILAIEQISQFADTVAMLRRPFASVGSFVARMCRKKNKRKQRFRLSDSQAAADAWLEYRYGWKPLLMDIEAIMNKIAEQRETLTRRLVFRASESVEKSISSAFTNRQLPGDFYYLRANGSYTCTKKVRASAGMICEVKPLKPLETFYKMFGLRAHDLPRTAWNVIPFSFVVDWFINVDEWLSAITPEPNIMVLGSWVTSVEEASTILNAGTITGNYYATKPPLTGSYSERVTKRVLIRRLSNPSTGTLPTLRAKPLSLVQLVDGISLLNGQIVQGLEKLRH